MNNASFAGNIGNIRNNTISTQSGPMSVMNFSLAVNKREKGPDGKHLTLWVDCALWGKRAEVLQQYLAKGSKVCVSGTVDVEMYTNNHQQQVPKMTLNVHELTMQGGGEQHQKQAAPSFDDDIIF